MLKGVKAAYDGTYLAAIYAKSNKLVLTLVGGGVFNNNYGQIAKAISEAHEQYSKFLPKTCEIVLPIYDRNYEGILSELKKYVKSYDLVIL